MCQGSHTGAAEECEEEGAAERMCDELTTTLVSSIPLCCCGGEDREIRKKRGVGGRYWSFGFISYYPTLAVKKSNFPMLSLFCR